MTKRDFGIAVIRFLLSVLTFSLVFMSITDLSIETTLYGLFGDIFEFSNAEGKQNAIQNLGLICEGFQNQKNSFYQLKDVCDEEKLAELNTDKINDKEFFQQFMISLTKLPDINLSKYKGLIIPLAFVIALLIGLLSLLHKKDYQLLLFNMGRMLLNVGIMLVLAFTIFHFYGIISPADTTSVLGSITGSDQTIGTVQEAFLILIPLVLARLFNIKYLIVGGSLLLAGITLLIIFRKKKRDNK